MLSSVVKVVVGLWTDPFFHEDCCCCSSGNGKGCGCHIILLLQIEHEGEGNAFAGIQEAHVCLSKLPFHFFILLIMNYTRGIKKNTK
jgi:hypothetical protein